MDELKMYLSSFWEWAGRSSGEYVKDSETGIGGTGAGNFSEYLYPLFDHMILCAKGTAHMKEISAEDVENFLTVLALDHEAENLLDWLKYHASVSFIQRIVECGVHHIQPNARWQIAELLRVKGIQNRDYYLHLLQKDNNAYVQRRTRSTLNFLDSVHSAKMTRLSVEDDETLSDPEEASEIPDAPPVDAGKQGKHVAGHINAEFHGSTWAEGENGVKKTQEAWKNSQSKSERPNVRIGYSSDGTKVEIHVDDSGRIHGFPVFQEVEAYPTQTFKNRLESYLSSFWEWAGRSSDEYAQESETGVGSTYEGDFSEYLYPKFDDMILCAKCTARMKEMPAEDVENFLTVLALDHEAENLLDWLKDYAPVSFIQRIVECGVHHIQPNARWQIAELLRVRDVSCRYDYLHLLEIDEDSYVQKRAQNSLAYLQMNF